MSRTAVTVRTAPAIDASARRQHRLCLRECRRPAAACVHLQPTHRCPALDSPLQSAASSTTSTATIGGKVAATFFTAASFFFDESVLFRCRCCCRGSLRGGLELQGGGCGGCGGAAVRQLAPNGSGAPPVHLWRLWRRCVGALAALASLPRLLKKMCASTAFFSHWRVHVRWARAPLQRANSALSNGIGVCGVPV